MSKWRPSELNCTYVIGDVHGMVAELELIFSRILPLRKSDGGHDQLVMLGDYIDNRPESHQVLDMLLEVQDACGDWAVFLKGNHEAMLIDALKESLSSADYLQWMKSGGDQTLSGYLQRAGTPMDNPYEIAHQRLSAFIPNEHAEFLNTLATYYETDSHIFVHAACDPARSMEDQKDSEHILWDVNMSMMQRPKGMIRRAGVEQTWEKTIVVGHNSTHKGPYRNGKFMMLDASFMSPPGVAVGEMKSGEAMIARVKKQRLVQLQL